MKLNGWHRLWILLSAIYFILVTSYVILEFPMVEGIPHQPEFYKELSKKSAGMITANSVEDIRALGGIDPKDITDWQEVPIQERGPWEDYQKRLKKEWDKAKPIEFHPIVEMPNRHSIQFKKDYRKEEMDAVSREYWHIVEQKLIKKRLYFAFHAFLFWVFPCLALYALGWSSNWVYKGFKQKSDARQSDPADRE